MTTFLENLEMSGNLTADRQTLGGINHMSGKCQENLVRENCPLLTSSLGLAYFSVSRLFRLYVAIIEGIFCL